MSPSKVPPTSGLHESQINMDSAKIGHFQSLLPSLEASQVPDLSTSSHTCVET